MSKKTMTLGALFAAVVGGCASTKSTVVPITPLAAEGVPIDIASYDLTIDGRSGGRLLIKDGQAIRTPNGQELIHVAVEIDNRTSDHAFTLPMDQVFLTNLGSEPAKLVQVDQRSAPGEITVPAGETRELGLAFAPARPIKMSRLRGIALHWTLQIDGGCAPIAKVSELAAVNTDVPGRKNYAAGELPGVQGYVPGIKFGQQSRVGGTVKQGNIGHAVDGRVLTTSQYPPQ
jgi:hypothetical protein